MTHAHSLLGGIPRIDTFGQKSPGVELVVPNSDNELLDVPCLRLIGALTRRMFPKIVRVRRAASSPAANAVAGSGNAARQHVDALITLTEGRTAWSDRISDYELIAQAEASGVDRVAVQIRGLGEDESAVLVDGRPAPGCVVDLAVAVSTFVERLRNGERCLVIVNPPFTNADEIELWESLLQLCQDRLGIERGVLEAASTANIASKAHALA